jgi:hypothetical protein
MGDSSSNYKVALEEYAYFSLLFFGVAMIYTEAKIVTTLFKLNN